MSMYRYVKKIKIRNTVWSASSGLFKLFLLFLKTKHAQVKVRVRKQAR